MDSDLDICPFCGGDAELYSDGGIDMVSCMNCPASMRVTATNDIAFDDDLIDQWNTRVTDNE